MPAKEIKTANGYIVAIQEERFRLMTDEGQALLLTLGRFAGRTSDLHRWHTARQHVRVEYSGEPNLESGVARSITPSHLTF